MFRARRGIIDHFSLNSPIPQLLLAVHAPFNDKAGLAKLAGNPFGQHGAGKVRADD